MTASGKVGETAALPRCIYCGWPTFPGRTACYAHSDLPELERNRDEARAR